MWGAGGGGILEIVRNIKLSAKIFEFKIRQITPFLCQKGNKQDK
jgi:hypothetical protein